MTKSDSSEHFGPSDCYVDFPGMPPSPEDDPRYHMVDCIWWVTGINFQFAFIDQECAEHYKHTADSFYGLGDLCRLYCGNRLKAEKRRG